MADLTADQEKTRELLFRLYPNAMALKDESITEVVKGEKEPVRSRSFTTNIDVSGIIVEAQHYVSVIAPIVSIVAGGTTIWKNLFGKSTMPTPSEIAGVIVAQLRDQLGHTASDEGLAAETHAIAVRVAELPTSDARAPR